MRVIYGRHPKYQRMMIVDLVSDFFVEYLAYVDALVDDDETFAAYADLDHLYTPQPLHLAGCVWLPFSCVVSLPGLPLLQMQHSLESVRLLSKMAPKVDEELFGGGLPLGLTIFPVRCDCDEPLGDAGAGRPP